MSKAMHELLIPKCHGEPATYVNREGLWVCDQCCKYLDTTLVLYGEPGRYVCAATRYALNQQGGKQLEYKMIIMNITDTTYDYESYYGGELWSTKCGLPIKSLDEEISMGKLRPERWAQ